jgi:chromosome segregation ATPase
MEQLTANRDRLSASISGIENEYQTAVNYLEELEQKLPALIASAALLESDGNELKTTRQEIDRLRSFAKEPYREAINIIGARIKSISEQINKTIGEQAAIDQELRFRQLFNNCLETHSRKSTDLDPLRNSAQHWHRKDIDLLDSLHYEFDNKGYHNLPNSPTFVEFASSKGLPLYNLDVTFENITRPKER